MSAVLALLVLLAGCSMIGPMHDHHPENKVNSPSDSHYQPPPDEKPILDTRTGQPKAKP